MSYDPRIDPWIIDESDFYEIEDAKEQKAFLLRYAVLAPSGHNTQPWTFRIVDAGIEVFADVSRSLPIADPAGRELLMSVGAAIANLRIAAAHFGFESTVLYNSATDDDNAPVATVALRETCCVDDKLRRLFPSITRRRTNRQEFERREIEPAALDALCDFADEQFDTIRFVVPHDRERTIELVANADRELMADEAWRNELAKWVHANESADDDGMSADAFGIPGPLSALGPWLIRSFDIGDSQAKHDREHIEHAAGLIVIVGENDRVSLIRAGEALEQLLLLLTSHDMAYSFLNAAVEVESARNQLWSLIRAPKPPQLLLRFGYAHPVRKAMPRRTVESVMV